jgi:hypothetical protein
VPRPWDIAVLIVLGALSAIVYAVAVPGPRLFGREPIAAHVVAFGVAFLLYLAVIRAVRRTPGDLRTVLAVVLGFALVFRLLQLPTPVYLSSDVYRYLWEGRVQLAGISPYRYPPAAPELTSLRDAEVFPHINRPGALTIYPPGAQWLFAVAAAMAPGLVGWRMLLLAIEGLSIVLLLRLLRRLGRPPTDVVVYAWSPLVVFEGIQAGHVDLAVIPLVLLALLWRQDGSSVRAGAALGVATLLKLYPAVLALAWWRSGDRRFPAALAATVALGYLPYAILHGPAALGFLPKYFSSAEDHNVGLRALLTMPVGLTGEPGRAVVMAVLFVAMAAALGLVARWRRDDDAGIVRAGAQAAGAWTALVPTSMHPWYVLWVVPFLCVTSSPAWLYFSGAVTLSYLAYVLAPAPLPWWVWMAEYLPLWMLLALRGRAGLVAIRAP